MLARRRQLARLERLAGPVIEHLSVAGARREREIATRIYRDALIHAANFSLIVLFGDPQINEPLSSAWERCCNSDSPKLHNPRLKKCMLAGFGDPFELQMAYFSAQHFRELVMPHLPGADEREKFARIFADAPLWLVWFTWADATMEALQLPPRDRSEICQFARSRENFCKWPALPSGVFERAPRTESKPKKADELWSEPADVRETSGDVDTLWDNLADIVGPRCGLLEWKYRFPEKFVK
jgi:hypothetical protein